MRVPILAGGSNIYQPDALDDYSQSAESGVVPRYKSKRWSPLGPNGEGVYRKLYINVQHSAGLAMYVVPVIDSVERAELKTFFSRGSPSQPTKESLLIELSEPSPSGLVMLGIRATTFQIVLEVSQPRASWDILGVQLVVKPLRDNRHRRAGE